MASQNWRERRGTSDISEILRNLSRASWGTVSSLGQTEEIGRQACNADCRDLHQFNRRTLAVYGFPPQSDDMSRVWTQRCRLWGIAAALFLTATTAHAACSSPTAAEGSLDYNASSHYFQYCDNTSTWQPLVSGGGGGFPTL
jgi:hypothetical protein